MKKLLFDYIINGKQVKAYRDSKTGRVWCKEKKIKAQ